MSTETFFSSFFDMLEDKKQHNQPVKKKKKRKTPSANAPYHHVKIGNPFFFKLGRSFFAQLFFSLVGFRCFIFRVT
jgi:hypothetical protein